MNEFLKKLANELKTQNNRCTANPLYIVQEKKRIYGVDEDYSEDWIYQWKEDPEYHWETEQEAIKALLEEKYEKADFDDFIEQVGYIEIWEFVTAHLTENAAQLYIYQNAHNLTEPRIYVSSQYRCHEFNKVVEHLKGWS